MPEENLPQSDIDALLAAMKREAEKQRRYNRLQQWIRVFFILFFVGSIIYVCGFNHHAGGLISLVNIFNLIPQALLKRLNNEQRKSTVAELSKANDVRILGPLCDALGFQHGEMAEIAQETLVTILPRLQASDAHLLNSEQRNNLYGTLSSGNRPLILATLKALEQIGDEKAVPLVEKLANGIPLTVEIREAARHCLPFLRERAAAIKAGQELLRASSLAAPAAELLRPASSAVTEPKELLRASNKTAG